MPWTAQVLVVANVTARAPELRRALEDRAARSPATFTLLVPGAGDEPHRTHLREALDYHRAAGLRIEGITGHHDPIVAVAETWDPMRFDEVIVSTIPGAASRWLLWDLPRRIAHLTDAPVRCVETRETLAAALA
jgi:hypothetical protein